MWEFHNIQKTFNNSWPIGNQRQHWRMKIPIPLRLKTMLCKFCEITNRLCEFFFLWKRRRKLVQGIIFDWCRNSDGKLLILQDLRNVFGLFLWKRDIWDDWVALLWLWWENLAREVYHRNTISSSSSSSKGYKGTQEAHFISIVTFQPEGSKDERRC